MDPRPRGAGQPPTRNVYRRRRWTALAAIALVFVAAGTLISLAIDGLPRDAPTPPTPAPPSATQATSEAEPVAIERIEVGRGARGATIIREEGSESGSLVILLHGWLVAGPDDYMAWATHLARAGNVVVMPRYQDAATTPDSVLDNALRGVQAAEEVLSEPETVVVAGHSAGGALAADYAAVASTYGVPAPDAVLAIFPGRAILGYPEGSPAADPAGIPADIRLLVMSSPNDTVVGEQPAQDILDTAVTVPASRKRLVSVKSAEAGDHYAPSGDTAAARRVFWDSLDRLIARVQPY